jgi:hypothetical protein
MNTPYDSYSNRPEWKAVNNAIQKLVANNDISLTTPVEYVVGYIVKNILDNEDISVNNKVSE